jgi:hypothetical protein
LTGAPISVVAPVSRPAGLNAVPAAVNTRKRFYRRAVPDNVIVGTGSYFPEQVVTNDDIERDAPGEGTSPTA